MPAGVVGDKPRSLTFPPGVRARGVRKALPPPEAVARNFNVMVLPQALARVAPKTVDEFIEQLPEWGVVNKAKPDSTKTTPKGTTAQISDGRAYTVTTTDYSVTETPVEIVTYQPVNGFWIGGLVQQKGLSGGLGSLQEISVPSTKRAAFKLTTDLPMAANFRELSNPSATTVSSALGSLMQAGNKSQWGGKRTMEVVDNYSEEQAAHELRLDARYMAANLSAGLKSERKASNHSISVAFTESAFTATADFEGRSRREAFFLDGFTVEDALALQKQGQMGADNLPAYVKSVTYGRIVLVNITSTLSQEEMASAINTSVNGGTFKVEANYDGSTASKTAQFVMVVTTIGGPQGSFSRTFDATGVNDVLAVMKEYLEEPAPLSTMMAISYTINSLRDNYLAKMAVTTNYTVTEYVANPMGERFKIKMWVTITDSGDGLDQKLECYGDLRVGGTLWWRMLADNAENNQREKGQTLEISEAPHFVVNGNPFTFDYLYGTKPPFTFILTLLDQDRNGAEDPFGKFSESVDLKSLVGKHTTWKYDSGKGEASTLHMEVERTAYL